MHFEEWMEHVVHGFEIVGIAVLAVGSIIGLARGAALLRQGDEHAAYRRVRHDIGQSILLGLEILIIADIVLTITIDPTLESALALALVVLVRTFLSFSLEIELDGVVPWHKGRQTERSEPTPAP
jgi:uncharacterized membrane protein